MFKKTILLLLLFYLTRACGFQYIKNHAGLKIVVKLTDRRCFSAPGEDKREWNRCSLEECELMSEVAWHPSRANEGGILRISVATCQSYEMQLITCERPAEQSPKFLGARRRLKWDEYEDFR